MEFGSKKRLTIHLRGHTSDRQAFRDRSENRIETPSKPVKRNRCAFTSVDGVDLELLLSIQHERIVRNDNTVTFQKTVLQLPPSEERLHYVRCTVLVHEFANGDLGVSHKGKLLGRFTKGGKLHIEEHRGTRRRVAKLKKPNPRAVAGPVWQA